jgi:creatinine amidohydrolase
MAEDDAREIRFELLRPAELLAERACCPLVFLPVGPLEYHGPHLPVGVDPIVATHLAQEACRRLGRGVVMPTLYAGTERERPPSVLGSLGLPADGWVVGMDFPTAPWKSHYYPEHLFGLALASVLEMLIGQGYAVIVVVNGHGADNQIGTIDRLARRYSQGTGARVLWRTNFRGGGPFLEEAGHADLYETSLMLHFEGGPGQGLGRHAVDLSALPPRPVPLRYADFSVVDHRGFTPEPDPERIVRRDPRDASAATGGEIFDLLVRGYVRMTEDALAERGG